MCRSPIDTPRCLREFAQKLAAHVQLLKFGRRIDEGTTQGPLVNVSAVQKVHRQVQDVRKKGAKLHLGGEAPKHLKGYFYQPMISKATTDVEVTHDETFGLLAVIFSFRDEKEAVNPANDTEFGLAGYFLIQDIGRVMTGLISTAETPFGGIGESGNMGRESCKYGLAEYQNIKAVTIGNL